MTAEVGERSDVGDARGAMEGIPAENDENAKGANPSGWPTERPALPSRNQGIGRKTSCREGGVNVLRLGFLARWTLLGRHAFGGQVAGHEARGSEEERKEFPKIRGVGPWLHCTCFVTNVGTGLWPIG